MKILIPDHMSEDEIKRIKQVSPDIEVCLLNVKMHESIVRKIARKIVTNACPYSVYQKLRKYLEYQPEYSFFVNNQPIGASRQSIEILLATPVIDNENFLEIIDLLPHLKWIHCTKTGTDHIDLGIIKNRKLKFTHSKNIHSRRIAEFMIGCIFEVSKKISKHVELKKQKKWAEIVSEELSGKTLGILGTGGIGTHIAEIAKPIGFNVVGWNSTGKQHSRFDKVFGPEALYEILKISDFLIVCLPLTNKTKELINYNKLSLMKPTSYIANAGRSEIIVEDDLIQALREAKIAGAVLDVFHKEMQLPNHPFQQLDNVLLTHYSAYNSKNSTKDIIDFFIKELKEFCECNDRKAGSGSKELKSG